MRVSPFLICLLIVFHSCNESAVETGRSIVEKSIVAHGGWENFKALKHIAFDKTTRLYNESGTLETIQTQRQDFTLKPNFLLRMSQVKDSIEHVFFYDQMNVEVFEDRIQVKTTEQINAAKKQGASAVYVFFQPFKLISDQANFTFNGEVRLLDSIKVKEVAVSYPNASISGDQWFYYFNEAYQLAAAKVVHDDRISLIVNTSFQEYEGVLFNKTRKSYFVNSENEIQYLRAAYEYLIN